MNPEYEEALHTLMQCARDDQQAVNTAVEGLVIERAALAKERAALTQAAASVVAMAADVRKAAAAVVPAAQRAVGDAVNASVRESLAGAAEAAAEALEKATQPVVGRLSGVVEAAKETEGSMRNAGAWFAWKWVAVAAGGLAGVCLVAYAALAWQIYQVRQVTDQKAALMIEVNQLQVKVDALEKRGGKLITSDCGGRLCFEVSSDQGKENKQWKNAPWGEKSRVGGFLIPKGF